MSTGNSKCIICKTEQVKINAIIDENQNKQFYSVLIGVVLGFNFFFFFLRKGIDVRDHESAFDQHGEKEKEEGEVEKKQFILIY